MTSIVIGVLRRENQEKRKRKGRKVGRKIKKGCKTEKLGRKKHMRQAATKKKDYYARWFQMKIAYKIFYLKNAGTILVCTMFECTYKHYRVHIFVLEW